MFGEKGLNGLNPFFVFFDRGKGLNGKESCNLFVKSSFGGFGELGLRDVAALDDLLLGARFADLNLYLVFFERSFGDCTVDFCAVFKSQDVS